MSKNDDLDVEQYKVEYECDEHWELRRNFLLAYKDKFPEDELICLAQVFTNVEFLGCRYPKETMELVAELAQDIAKNYREKQKNKIQRTFVKASDAASSKIKGTSAPTSSLSGKGEPQSGQTKRLNAIKTEKHLTKRIKLSHEPYGNIILVQRSNDPPQNILSSAVYASGGDVQWKFDRVGDKCKCTILVNSKHLATAVDANQKVAKKMAAIDGLTILQKHYYTIKVKQNLGEANVSASLITENESKVEESMPQDNIGTKIMKLMGWTGGGLGKSQQGIVEPVGCSIKQQITRDGLGLKTSNFTMRDFKHKLRDILNKYLMGDMRSDLVFSTDFTNEERAAVHQLTRQLGLKSHSYGPKNQRTLVVSRKIDIQDLVVELKELGGSTDKYELIEPTGL